MRKLLILGAASLFAAAPALAQPQDYEDDPRYEEEWEEDEGVSMPHPGQLQAMAGVMDRLVGAVMDLPIGGIVAAVDPYGRGEYRRGDTVRDMAERDDPYAEERMRAGIQGATRGIGVMSEAFGRMMPVLQRSIDDISEQMEDAMADADLGPRR